MTRRMVYSFGLLLTAACTIMTIASIVMPRWVSYIPNDKRESSIGLHRRCSLLDHTCHSYPKRRDCDNGKQSFCHMWRTTGFLISFSVIVELCALVSFVVIISGGVQRRIEGWKVITSVLTLGAVVQCAGMAIIAYLFDNDGRFFEGWELDASFTLATASWSILILTALGITASALYLPAEGDYELIPDSQMTHEQDEQLQSRISGWNDGYGYGQSYQNDRD